MKSIVKYFTLAEILFLGGVVLDLDKYLFSWQTYMYFIGRDIFN
jgi:hypothetical protein